jgi:hypothetical protein
MRPFHESARYVNTRIQRVLGISKTKMTAKREWRCFSVHSLLAEIREASLACSWC